MFLKLTGEISDLPVWVNAAHVQIMQRSGASTILLLVGGQEVKVKEPPDAILIYMDEIA